MKRKLSERHMQNQEKIALIILSINDPTKYLESSFCTSFQDLGTFEEYLTICQDLGHYFLLILFYRNPRFFMYFLVRRTKDLGFSCQNEKELRRKKFVTSVKSYSFY